MKIKTLLELANQIENKEQIDLIKKNTIFYLVLYQMLNCFRRIFINLIYRCFFILLSKILNYIFKNIITKLTCKIS